MRSVNLRLIYMFLAIATLAVSGCASDSTSPETPPATITPNPGSYLLTRNEVRDSTGLLVSADTTKETINQIGLTIYGKSNVIQLIDSQDGIPTDTSYIHYEPNGDVTSYAGSQAALVGGTTNGWLTLPFGSQTTVTSSSDTTVDFQTLHLATTISGAGRGTLQIKDSSFTTEKLSVTIDVSIATGGQTISTTQTSTVEFAPALGDVVRQDTPGIRDPVSGALSNSQHNIVVAYVLK